MTGRPPAEIEVNESLVRQLIVDQHPDLADLPIEHVDAGWDNEMFRLGSSLAVRLPRREIAAGLIQNEQRWLPTLAARLSLPIPSPVRVGLPGRTYPWRWSIVPWLAGSPADVVPPDASQALPLAKFLRALHQPAPSDAPVNPFRAPPLSERTGDIARLNRLREKTSLITPAVEAAWTQGRQTTPATDKCWLHGDLHPRNVLVRDGIITGIIDWGDITAGDRAVDLASIWMLLSDHQARQVALDHYGACAATVARAKAWAVVFGMSLAANGLVNDPIHAAIGATTLARVEEDQT